MLQRPRPLATKENLDGVLVSGPSMPASSRSPGRVWCQVREIFELEIAMTTEPLLDLRPEIDDREFRALLLLLVGWRNEPELDQQRLEQVIQSYRNNPQLQVLGFKRAGIPVALVTIELERSGAAVIHHLVVRSELRGQGLGRALLQRARVYLAVSSISAETDRNAVGFYERCGFRKSSLGEKYPGVERFWCRIRAQATRPSTG